MKQIIKNITNIHTGVFAKPLGAGDIVYLQVKHFDENGVLQQKLHGEISSKDISERHLLKPGDVIFAAKGFKNFAALYESHNEPAVASTSFFVVKLTTDQVIPEYIVWFLNSNLIQSILKTQAIGSSLPSISKQVLENLQIQIPDIKTQQVIVEISKLRKKEKSLKQKIEMLREKQIQQQIINAIK